jgi:DNA-binding protein H-NS
MSDLDFTEKSISEIDDIITKAQAAKNAKRQAGLKDAFKKLQAMAQELGVSVEQILEAGNMSTTKSNTQKLPDKFRDPKDHTLTWSGRGKPPRWMEAALQQGKSKADFLIVD